MTDDHERRRLIRQAVRVIATTIGYRWWSLDDLRDTTEHVLDNQREIIEKALTDLI